MEEGEKLRGKFVTRNLRGKGTYKGLGDKLAEKRELSFSKRKHESFL